MIRVLRSFGRRRRPASSRASAPVVEALEERVVPSVANDKFVGALYHDLLHRTASPNELVGWVNALDQGGLNRSEVATQFVQSLEYRQDAVTKLYADLLGRAPDPGGLQGFVDFLGSGGRIRQVQTIILGSDEYFARLGGDQAAFVDSLYVNVFGRHADPQGQGNATWLLNSGYPRTQVAGYIVDSVEATIDTVTDYYQSYLHRGSPQDAGVLGWANAILAGNLADAQVQVGIVASDEYFAIAQNAP